MTGELRVLHVYRTYFPDPPGGLQEAIQQIALGTKAFRIEAKIFALSPNPRPGQARVNGIDVYRERSWAAPASCDLGSIAAVRKFRELAEWADVVHFHFPWPYADVLNFCVPNKCARVMTYHSDIVRQRLLSAIYRPLMRKTLSSMDAVVATSPNYAATSAVLSKFVSVDKLKIIPLGIADRVTSVHRGQSAPDLLERYRLSGSKFVLALGVLRYYKGLQYLIKAAAEINCPVVIAGSGPEGKSLLALTRDLGLSNVIFTGQVSDTEKDALLQACTVFAFPSHLRSEAFGMVIVEASMYSKPMVTCEIGSGMSYVNADGVTGFVIPPESPSALAGAVNQLLADSSLANTMGCAARRRYETHFSDAILGRKYGDLYREVLEKRHQ